MIEPYRRGALSLTCSPEPLLRSPEWLPLKPAASCESSMLSFTAKLGWWLLIFAILWIIMGCQSYYIGQQGVPPCGGPKEGMEVPRLQVFCGVNR